MDPYYPQPPKSNIGIKLFIILIIIILFSIGGYFLYTTYITDESTDASTSSIPTSTSSTPTSTSSTPTSTSSTPTSTLSTPTSTSPTPTSTSSTPTSTTGSTSTPVSTSSTLAAGIQAVKDFITGQSITCSSGDPKGNGSGAIYKYTGNNTINWYPNPTIANSWDKNFMNFKTIDCTGLTKGSDVILNTNLGDTILPGSEIPQNSQMTSSNGEYILIMQGDGNLVLYKTGQGVIWATNTEGKGKGPYKLVFQSDNNLVIYDSIGSVLWATNTEGKTATRLILQNDGNLVIYNGHTPIWGR
jgi:hypothetical protein